MILEKLKILRTKLFPTKEYTYHLPDPEIIFNDFKKGDYVARVVFQPYDCDYMEYGQIVGKYEKYKYMYDVQKLGQGEIDGKHVWYGSEMERISELDAFLRTLES